MEERTPPGLTDKILHATPDNPGTTFYRGADAFPGQYERPKGFYIVINIADPMDAERIFNKLAENGTVQMPMTKTFWSVSFGVLIDQFAIPWEINCEQAPIDADWSYLSFATAC